MATRSGTSAFLKPTTTTVQLAIGGTKILKIKLEVDTDPPLGFNTEEQLLMQPFSFYVQCFSLPDLFAEKMHAVLFRQWQQRVKGRDWFDLEWFVRQGIPLHLDLIAFPQAGLKQASSGRTPAQKRAQTRELFYNRRTNMRRWWS